MATDIFEIEGTTIIETVRILNEEVYDFLSENYGGTFPLFELLTDGNSIIITFMGHHRLWFSDEDEREFDEDKDEYEPLEGYLRREAQEIINQIGNVKLLQHDKEEAKEMKTETSSLMSSDEYERKQIHKCFMGMLQKEWEGRQDIHKGQREENQEGIRSSQISALVMLLIELGVLK